MKYAVMNRGNVQLRTDDIKVARKKMESLGESSFIYYGKRARKEYETTHAPLKGEKE